MNNDGDVTVKCPHCGQVVSVPDRYAAVEALAAHLAAGTPNMCAPWQIFDDPAPNAICTCGHRGDEHEMLGCEAGTCQCGAFVSPASPFWRMLTPPDTAEFMTSRGQRPREENVNPSLPGYDARRRRIEQYAAAQLKAAHPDEWAAAWAEGEQLERFRDTIWSCSGGGVDDAGMSVERWRTGRKKAGAICEVYVHSDGNIDGELVGIMATPELAQLVADTINERHVARGGALWPPEAAEWLRENGSSERERQGFWSAPTSGGEQ